MNIVLVVGSTVTPPGRTASAVSALAEFLRAEYGDVTVTVVDLSRAELDTCDGRPIEAYGESTRNTIQTFMEASAVIFSSPVYRASFPGGIKNLLDLLPVETLKSKPVGLVVVGATLHHYLMEAQLRLVLGWFGALVTPTSVYLTEQDFGVLEGELLEDGVSEVSALGKTVVALCKAVGNIPLGPDPLSVRAKAELFRYRRKA